MQPDLKRWLHLLFVIMHMLIEVFFIITLLKNIVFFRYFVIKYLKMHIQGG